MTTYTSRENLHRFNKLNWKARGKAFVNLKNMYLSRQGPDFIEGMKNLVAQMGIKVEDYYFAFDTASLWLVYPHRNKGYFIKGVRAYAFIQNNFLNRCQKRRYRMKVYDRWNQPWSVYHGMKMIISLEDKKWMQKYEYRALKNAWEKFKVQLRSGKEPSVADFIYMLRDEYVAQWLKLSKGYTDFNAGWDAMKYMFDENGDIYVYDKYADIRVDY